jgi:hypothetical protein
MSQASGPIRAAGQEERENARRRNMTTLVDSIEIKAAPERIFNGLIRVFSSEEDFKEWHEDHVECRWLRGKPFEIGSVL